MKQQFISFTKSVLMAGAIIVALQLTGLFNDISVIAHSAILKTGLLDAKIPEESAAQPDFDFNFAVKDSQGIKKPFEQFKGKVIFLNLWATWCGPCRAEMPTIQELYGKLDHDKIDFVMLSIDRDQDKDKIVRYIENKKFTFPVYQPSGYLSQQLNVPTIPTTFIVSPDGKIVAKYIGTTDFDSPKFKKFIEELYAK